MDSIVIVKETRGSVMIFDSVISAENYVEAIDVKNDEYIFYNGTGQSLTPKIVSNRNGMEWVSLTVNNDSKTDYSAEVRKLLVELLSSEYEKEELASLDLENLVKLSLQYKTR